MFAPHSPMLRLVPSLPGRLFITGLMLGGAGSLVAITPLGRLSGAHLNPAISLGFFAEGRMAFHDLCAYALAQVVGACLGAFAGDAVFGRFADAVLDALNQPGKQVSSSMAVLAEVGATFVLAIVIFVMVSHRRTMRWTPLAVIPVVAVLVLLDGNFSGASLNPARSFGPAVVTHQWQAFWIYVIGPCSGSVLAGLLHRFGMRLEAKTGKLFHDIDYRSIFTGHEDHAANTHVRSRAGIHPEERPPLRNRPSDGSRKGLI